MITTTRQSERVRCRLILHLPTGDVPITFSHFEDLGRCDASSMYRFIYFEDSADPLHPEYEMWHEFNIWHGHTPEARPCSMTVQVLDSAERVASSFRCTDVLPERSFMAPVNDSPEAHHVLKAVDFRYIERRELGREDTE